MSVPASGMVVQLLAPPGPSAASSASSSWRGSSPGPARRSARQEDLLALPEGAEQRFDLLEEVGQGTYGLVHRAIDLPTGRQVPGCPGFTNIKYHTVPYHTIPYHTIPYHIWFFSMSAMASMVRGMGGKPAR